MDGRELPPGSTKKDKATLAVAFVFLRTDTGY